MPFRLLLCGAIAVALAACSDQSQTPSDPSNPSDPPPIASQQLTSLTLRPASIWLVQADTFAAFIPVGRTVAGDTVRPSVNWQASGGQMTADGRYIAGLDTGTYRVTATVSPVIVRPRALNCCLPPGASVTFDGVTMISTM